jgi:hypothetical protein
MYLAPGAIRGGRWYRSSEGEHGDVGYTGNVH